MGPRGATDGNSVLPRCKRGTKMYVHVHHAFESKGQAWTECKRWSLSSGGQLVAVRGKWGGGEGLRDIGVNATTRRGSSSRPRVTC